MRRSTKAAAGVGLSVALAGASLGIGYAGQATTPSTAASQFAQASPTVAVPPQVVPFRPFTVAVQAREPGLIVVSARRTSRLKELVRLPTVGGPQSIEVLTKWLDVSAIEVSFETADGAVSSATPVQTLRRPYAQVKTVTHEQLGSSWKSGCPVGASGLRALEINHINYKGKVRRGRIIVSTEAIPTVRKAFKRAFKKDFRIRRMVPVDQYGGSDDRSMRADNTSGYACRGLPSGAWSQHAYGNAVDINPRRNPHLLTPLAPTNARKFVKRKPLRAGMIDRNSVVTKVFLRRGWGWGAVYRSPDYQHFSATGG